MSAPAWMRLLCASLLVAIGGGCARRSVTPPASNELLIVGYDREPDTLNRFSTHILEDIQTAVVEGLTVTDEQMRIVPLLASRSAFARERRRAASARWRHGRHLEAAAEHLVA